MFIEVISIKSLRNEQRTKSLKRKGDYGSILENKIIMSII